jgi:hypothetical protein
MEYEYICEGSGGVKEVLGIKLVLMDDGRVRLFYTPLDSVENKDGGFYELFKFMLEVGTEAFEKAAELGVNCDMDGFGDLENIAPVGRQDN